MRRLDESRRSPSGPSQARAALTVPRPRSAHGVRCSSRATSTVPRPPRASSSCARCEHRRRRSRARARGRDRRREGEPVPPADVYVVRDAHRHPWMRQAADVPGAVVVETGLPVWRPSRATATSRRTAAGARSLEAARGTAGAVTSHLERELRRAAGGARAADREAARLRRADPRALPPQRRAVHPDRVARQLVERGALRAVPARPRPPRAGRVRDTVALHALRAAAAARRRARRRHLAVRRVARRRRGRRRGAPAGTPDDRDHEHAVVAARAGRGRRAEARGGQGAGRRRDEDVRQLARRDRAALRDDDRDAQALAELEPCPAQLQAQIERSWSDVSALDRLRSTAAPWSRAASTTARPSRSRSRSASSRASSSRRIRPPT